MTRLQRGLMGYIGFFASVCFFVAGAAAQGARSDAEIVPVYKPPLRGAPSSRVGGGSRAIGTEMPRIYVMAPVDIGFTTKGKPDLYWFVSGTTPAKVLLTVFVDDPAKPVLEQNLVGVSAPGPQRVKLSTFSLELQPKVEYRWRITLIDESGDRTARALAGGAIQRVDAWPSLLARLKNTDKASHASVFAEEGLWYDAIELISESIDAAPGNLSVRKQRAGLLSQVGLTEASNHDAGQK